MSALLLQISAGQGPVECRRAVALLGAHLAGQAGGLSVRVVEVVPEPQRDDCFLSLTLRIEGEGADAFCKHWCGSVLWRCQSPFRPNHSRKNWYVGVSSFPVPLEGDPALGPVRLSYFRASGPGGQHVNKTSSAVRLHHEESGITVTASEERSQARNRKLAWARLWAALQRERGRGAASAQNRRRSAHYQLERGNPVNTFTGPEFKPTRS